MDSTSATSWDDDDFEPVAAAVKASDKWEGEDEEDDVKDAWDISSEEENSQKDEKISEANIVKRKKKKKLADIIAEKEEAKQKELDDLEAADELNKLNDTPEAKLAEKLRLQKEVEQNELRLARELLGGDPGEGTIDAMSPETKEDFDEFEKALSEKICQFSESEHYPNCVETLIKNICCGLNSTTLKKIKSDVEAFHSAKLKEEKAAKTGKKPGKPKATLKRDLDRDLYGGAINDYGNDMDDFM